MTGIVSAVTGILSGITNGLQNAHMIDILASIEHNTRYSMFYLGERTDGGILGVGFRMLDTLLYGTSVKALESIRDILGSKAFGGTTTGFSTKDLDLIQGNTYWSLVKLDRIDQNIDYMAKSAPRAAINGNGSSVMNFNFYGVQDARDMAQAVVSELKLMGVHPKRCTIRRDKRTVQVLGNNPAGRIVCQLRCGAEQLQSARPTRPGRR